ncbi:hypothetical protein BGZ94_000435 [Podila epigama]|nr:hypothetical protein BGZ94_000435 [Podila epigama]
MTSTKVVLQGFQYDTVDDPAIHSLPTLVCPESGQRYIPWQSIVDTYSSIDYLMSRAKRVQFMTDKALNVIEPLRIAYNPENYDVVLVQESIDENGDPWQDENPLTLAERLFETSSGYYELLKYGWTRTRRDFLEVIANARYWFSKVRTELDDLEKAGALTSDHRSRRDEMLDELTLLEEMVENHDYNSVCHHTFRQIEVDFATPVPRTIVVLPSDLVSWDESNPNTHSFRCYFLCEVGHYRWANGKLYEKYHLSDHPGYDLLRPQEFFQRYGDYALRVLRAVLRGFSDGDVMVPPLETFEILSGHSSGSSEKRLHKETLEQLVNKSIGYIEKLGLPQKERLGLLHMEICGIEEYMNTEHDEEGLGDLFRCIRDDLSSWVCKEHFQCVVKIDPIEEARQFIEDCGGKMDLHRGVIKVELSSESVAEEFATYLRGCSNVFDVSIKLTWPATRQFLYELICTLYGARVMWVELDGVMVDVYPEGFVKYAVDLFDTTGQRFLTLLNYPRQGEQYTAVDKVCFQSPMPEHQRAPFCWIRGALAERWTRELEGDGRGAGEESEVEEDHLQKTAQMMAAITGDDLPHVSWTKNIHYDMDEAMDLKSGAIGLHLHLDIMTSYSSVKSRFLRQLTAEAIVPVFDPDFVALVQQFQHLEELNVAAQGRCSVGLAEHLIKSCRSDSKSLIITLFGRPMEGDEQSHIIVQMALDASRLIECDSTSVAEPENDQGNSKSIVLPRSYFEAIECRQWNNDDATTPSTLEQALLLDRWTEAFPWLLKFFTLDISGQSLETLVVLQSILHRSRLCFLHISCRPIDPSLQKTVHQVLESIEWSSIQCLVLAGECIGPWVELLAKIYEERDLDALPMYLAIEDNGLSPSPLSHSGALALHRLVYLRSMDDVQLRNIQFQDEKDRQFVIDALEADTSVAVC